jgi:hypothetical protein
VHFLATQKYSGLLGEYNARAGTMPGGAFGCLWSTMALRALAVEMISAAGRNLELPPLWSFSLTARSNDPKAG